MPPRGSPTPDPVNIASRGSIAQCGNLGDNRTNNHRPWQGRPS
ncbi:hypothetical protein HMPREF9607_01717 [Cutibacterium modestum HL044PA1]|uniref:Uncharacterized protein n=1 Tax=Cutibacterium modestum HL044PA1 TaxID=765109 RepID=A0ABP2K7X1_9ACTN|nr:hypothetical protein HMPREF9607_01717 [Cutibacterium modestum HL044PA1]